MRSKHVWTDLYIADAAEHGGKVKIRCQVSNQPGMPCKGEESLTEEPLLVHRRRLLLHQSEWHLIAHCIAGSLLSDEALVLQHIDAED